MVPDDHNLLDDSLQDLNDVKEIGKDVKGAIDSAKELSHKSDGSALGKSGSKTPGQQTGSKAGANAQGPAKAQPQQATPGGTIGGASGGTSAAVGTPGVGASTSTVSSSATGGASSGAAAGAGEAAAGSAASGAASGAATGAKAGSVAGPAGTVIGAAAGLAAKPVIKFVIALALCVIFFMSAIIMSLPRVIFGDGFNLNSFAEETLSFQDIAIQIITEAYADVFNTIVAQAERGGYDVDLTISNIVDMSGGANNVDMAYLISAYSVSMQNSDLATSEDMINKLRAVRGSLYRFDTRVEIGEKEVPVTVDAYEQYTFTIAASPVSEEKTYYERTGVIPFYMSRGIYTPIYRPVQVTVVGANGRTETLSLYEKTDMLGWRDPLNTQELPTYRAVTVNVPVSPETREEIGYRKIGTREIDTATTIPTYEEQQFTVLTSNNTAENQTHLVAVGEEEAAPEIIEVEYLAATIHPLQRLDINRAFSLNLNDWYYESKEGASYEGVRNFQVLDDMVIQFTALLNENNIQLNRTYTEGGTPFEPPDIQALYPGLMIPPCSDNRMFILETGATLVGRVPYFFGGNHGSNYCHPGWNDAWNTELRVVPAGSRAGQRLPFGIDCSGFVKWTYATAFGVDIFGRNDYTGTMMNSSLTYPIRADELLPGDLGLSDGHVGIFAGYNQAGQRVWLHSRTYLANDDDIAFSTHSGLVHFRRVAAVADRLEQNDLRQEADLMTRMGVAIQPQLDIDYTAQEYQWLAHLQDQPAMGRIRFQKKFTVKYYCKCPDCSGEESRPLTSTGQHYRTGIVASSDLPAGTRIGLYGKIFTVQDTRPNAEPDTIYIYLPQHSLLSVVSNRAIDIPVYE